MAMFTASSAIATSTLCFKKSQLSFSSTKLMSSELGFLNSQFTGVKISLGKTYLPRNLSAQPRLRLQPVASRICPFTGKKSNTKNLVSHSNHKTKKLQFVNLQYKRFWWEEGKRYVKLRLSTKAIKTIGKYGLDAAAKKAGIDLRKK